MIFGELSEALASHIHKQLFILFLEKQTLFFPHFFAILLLYSKRQGGWHMGYFAVIDTETNWADQVMSIGTVLVESSAFRPAAVKYHILPAQCEMGGMYYNALFLKTPVAPIQCTREAAIKDLLSWFQSFGVEAIFAYNAKFDRAHLLELGHLCWHDIMALAAYRQHNPRLPACAEFFSTGRMKRGYGVEPMLRILSGDYTYRETHNALFDALDELEIMRLLGHSLSRYRPL